MKFIILLVLLTLFLISPLWGLIGAMAYILFWFFSEQNDSQLRNINETNDTDKINYSQLDSEDLADLMVLRLEIDGLYATSVLSQDEVEFYHKQIDSLVKLYLMSFSARPTNQLWRERRESAWKLLESYSDVELGHPPWKEDESQEQHEEPEAELDRFDNVINVEETQQEIPLPQEPLTKEVQQELPTQLNSIEELSKQQPETE